MPNMQWQSVNQYRVGKWCALEIDVDTAVQFGSMLAIHLTPPAVAVGCEPQVGLVHVSKQQELLYDPHCRHADNEVSIFGTQNSVGCPALVLPQQVDVTRVRCGNVLPRRAVTRRRKGRIMRWGARVRIAHSYSLSCGGTVAR